jgi:hypothetical protein
LRWRASDLLLVVAALLAVHSEATVSVELDSRSQAGDLLVVLGGDVGEDGVLSGRDLLGQLDVFGQGGLALLDRALEVDLLDLGAEVGVLPDDGDQAVLDLQVHLGAVFNVLREVTAGDDAEGLTAVTLGQRMSIRFSSSGTYALGGLGFKSTLLSSRISSLGLSQWFNGLLPGTESESSKVTSEPPKRELAEAVARIAEAMVRNFILCCVVFVV